MPIGPVLTYRSVLAKGAEAAAIYLVTNGQKMLIPNPPVFDLFNFAPNKVVVVPQVVIDFLPQGSNVG